MVGSFIWKSKGKLFKTNTLISTDYPLVEKKFALSPPYLELFRIKVSYFLK